MGRVRRLGDCLQPVVAMLTQAKHVAFGEIAGDTSPQAASNSADLLELTAQEVMAGCLRHAPPQRV